MEAPFAWVTFVEVSPYSGCKFCLPSTLFALSTNLTIVLQPTTAIAFASDGVDKVRRLRFYDISKSMESNNEVRQSALMVWELLTDGPRLFLRRKQVLTNRARLFDTNVSHRWGDNVRSKLPFETDFRRYHTVLRPFNQPSGKEIAKTPLRRS
jgi:hypothetical protein